MNARDRTGTDPDDWFDEPPSVAPQRTGRGSFDIDPDAQTREQIAPPVDDWLAPEQPRRRRPSTRTSALADRRLLIALGIALAVFFAALALAGVFSGGANKHATRPPTTGPTTATTQTPAQTVPLAAATLKPGDHGKGVEELQRALSALGYTIGKIDGVFGPSTERSLVAFQRAHRLSPDGVVGPATRAALLNALRPG